MEDVKSVFVIGAGASNEIHLPTGNELKKTISGLLDFKFRFEQCISGDQTIVSALREIVNVEDGGTGSIAPYIKEALHIRDALPQAISIDNFIDSQKNNEEMAVCAKLAIVRVILRSEENSKFYIDKLNGVSGIDLEQIMNTWYHPFFQILTENCGKENLKERFQSIAIIIFNYDRCVEHFLFYALKNYYRIDDEEAAEIVNCISIYHPYGKVGGLPWSGEEFTMPFGENPNPQDLITLSKGIKTFTEGINPGDGEILEIQKSIHGTGKLVFLGFAFHKLNMELLRERPAECLAGLYNPKCFGTAFGVSESDKEFISKQLTGLFHYTRTDVSLSSNKCFDFFNEYWRSLSF